MPRTASSAGSRPRRSPPHPGRRSSAPSRRVARTRATSAAPRGRARPAGAQGGARRSTPPLPRRSPAAWPRAQRPLPSASAGAATRALPRLAPPRCSCSCPGPHRVSERPSCHPPVAHPIRVEERGGPFHKGGLRARPSASLAADRAPKSMGSRRAGPPGRVHHHRRTGQRSAARTQPARSTSPSATCLADGGYDSDRLRALLIRRGTIPVIPNGHTRKRLHPFDMLEYRRRNIVERMFCRLKDWRRVATR